MLDAAIMGNVFEELLNGGERILHFCAIDLPTEFGRDRIIKMDFLIPFGPRPRWSQNCLHRRVFGAHIGVSVRGRGQGRHHRAEQTFLDFVFPWRHSGSTGHKRSRAASGSIWL